MVTEAVAGTDDGGRSGPTARTRRIRSGSRDDRQIERKFRSAAEDFVRIGQDAGCRDVDDDSPVPMVGSGDGFDREWRFRTPSGLQLS